MPLFWPASCTRVVQHTGRWSACRGPLTPPRLKGVLGRTIALGGICLGRPVAGAESGRGMRLCCLAPRVKRLATFPSSSTSTAPPEEVRRAPVSRKPTPAPPVAPSSLRPSPHQIALASSHILASHRQHTTARRLPNRESRYHLAVAPHSPYRPSASTASTSASRPAWSAACPQRQYITPKPGLHPNQVPIRPERLHASVRIYVRTAFVRDCLVIHPAAHTLRLL